MIGPSQRHYPTPQNTHKRQISTLPAGFKFSIPSSVRPQTHTLDRAAIENGLNNSVSLKHKHSSFSTQKLYLQQPYSVLILSFKSDIKFLRVIHNKFYPYLS